MGNKGFLKFISVALAATVLTACGGGDVQFGGTGTGTGAGGGGTAAPASVKLIANAAQLPSSATTSTAVGAVTLTAIVKDAKNNLLSGVPVTFSSKSSSTGCGSGGAVTGGGATDAGGTVSSTLTTAGDQANQIITVTVTAGSQHDSLDVPVVGTHLQVTGSSGLGLGGTAIYSVSLLDSSNNGIGNQKVTISSALNNGLSASFVTTNSSGQGQVTYTATHGGADTLSFSAACATSAQLPIQVSNISLGFTTPDPSNPVATKVAFDNRSTLIVKLQGVSPLIGQTIKFSTTRGTFLANVVSPSGFVAGGTVAQGSVTTDASGVATIDLKQPTGPNGVGTAIITATTGTGTTSASATAQVDIVSTVPAGLIVQSLQSVVQANGSTPVSAVLRDANDNPVEGQTINFTLSGIGNLSAGSGVTDSQGTALVTYTAPATTSGTNNISVNGVATVGAVTLTDSTSFTVGGKALNIVLAPGNKLSSKDDTEDQMPYSVIVQDSAGFPVQNAIVNLTLSSAAYEKGKYTYDTTAWVQHPTVACPNEDVNLNGILDSGEDTNGNHVLDPGGVATVSPTTIVLDSTGSGLVQITYPKDHASWVAVTLTATVQVAGSEGVKSATFPLLGLDADYSVGPTIAIPGRLSPYGTASSCSIAD